MLARLSFDRPLLSSSRSEVVLVITVRPSRIVRVHWHRRPIGIDEHVRGISRLMRIVMRVVVVVWMVLRSPTVVNVRSAAVH